MCSSSSAARAGSTGSTGVVRADDAAPAPVRERRPQPLAAGQDEVAGGPGEAAERRVDRLERGDLAGEEVGQGALDRGRRQAGRRGRSGGGIAAARVSLERVVGHAASSTVDLRVASIAESISLWGCPWTQIWPRPTSAAVSCTNATAARTIWRPGCCPRGSGATCTRSTASPGTPTRSSTAPTTCRRPSARPGSTDWSERFVAGLHGEPVDDPLLPGGAAHHRRLRPRPRRLRRVPAQHGDGPDGHVATPTYDDLLDYMEGSAAVIGTMMLPILGSRRPGRRPRAGPPARPRLPAHQLHPRRRRGPRPRPHLPARRATCEFGVTRADLADAAPRRRHAADQGPDPVRGGARPRRTTRPPRPGIPLLDARLPGLHPHRVPRSTAASSTRSSPPTTTCSPAAPRCPTGAGPRWPLRALLTRPARRSPCPADACGAGLMKTAVVLFTRDLRVHDNPALAAACANAERVVPLFVLDPALAGLLGQPRPVPAPGARRPARRRSAAGAATWWCAHGDPVAETIRLAREVGAEGIALAADVSGYARRRERRLRAGVRAAPACRCGCSPGVTVVDPGDVRPGGGDHYRVFSPYHRAWAAAKWRDEVAAPRTVTLPTGVAVGRLPGRAGRRVAGRRRPAARPRAGSGCATWLGHVGPYDDLHDDLAGDGTSRLSPYLRFGCCLAAGAGQRARCGRRRLRTPFVRQLCWRDFYYQVAYAFPEISHRAPTGAAATDEWRDDEDALRGLAGRADRGADRGRRHAPAARRGLDAQPGPADHRVLPDQAPRPRLAARASRVVLPLAARRRRAPTTRATGSGWPAPATTPSRTAGSTRSGRPSASTPTACTFVATYPNWHRSRARPCTSRGGCPTTSGRGLDYPGPLESHRDEAVWLRP